MAYFKWLGIDECGQYYKGILIAPTVEAFLHLFSVPHVTLVDWYEIPEGRIPFLPVKDKARFFKQLALLLRSGVRLYDALRAAQVVVQGDYFKAVILDCAQSVHKGTTLSDAFKQYVPLFDDITVQLVAAGEQSGSLVGTLEQRALQLEELSLFTRKMRQALLLPAVSFVLFLILAGALFAFVIPYFKSMFMGLNKPLPALTQRIFALSDWFLSVHALYFGIACIGVIFFIWRIIKTEPGRRMWGTFILRIPGIGLLVQDIQMSLFFQTCSLLLAGGVRLVESVQSAGLVVSNATMREMYIHCARKIASGALVADAFRGQNYGATHDIIALLSIGEASGNLARMMAQSGELCKERVTHKLDFISSMIQPLVLIVLGLLIATLACALYEPLLTFTSLVG